MVHPFDNHGGGGALDPENARLIVTDTGADAIFAVDLATATRSVLSADLRTS